jgi:hypothetical protein
MLVDALRARLGDPRAASFQLMGEDLVVIGAAELRAAIAEHAAALDRLPPGLRDEVEREDAAVADEAHRWLRRHNRNVHGRIAGYLELGRRCRFDYPWPVVAILGICQVLTGMRRNRLYGLIGGVADRIGWPVLERIAEGSDDVLRRTNRGIFADSVPTVLRALRADELRRAGRPDLAAALVDVPAVLGDAESRALGRALADGLAIDDADRRFAALAALTLAHFAREQAVFTYQMGPRRAGGSKLAARLVTITEVPAPVVERDRLGRRRVAFRPYRLPRGFDIHDHDARVRAFGDAFVSSITADVDDYRAAAAWVVARFGRPGERTGP